MTLTINLCAALSRAAKTITRTVAALAVTAGAAHAQFTALDWGNNGSGQLGDFTNINRNLPVSPLSPSGAPLQLVAVAGGLKHSLGLDISGNVWAWGDNSFGQLGDGTFAAANKPHIVWQGAIAIACGDYHSILLMKDNTVWETGSNSFGQLGNAGPIPNSGVWVPVLNAAGAYFKAYAIAGGGYHTIAVGADQKYQVYTWGRNNYGQLGLGGHDLLVHPVPAAVPGLVNVVPAYQFTGFVPPNRYWNVIGAGRYHSLAVISTPSPAVPFAGGFPVTWGDNTKGQLGDGTAVEKDSPVIVKDASGSRLPNIVSVGGGAGIFTAGSNYDPGGDSILLTFKGNVWTMGSNDFGQLGSGGADALVHPIPFLVKDPTNATGILQNARCIGAGGFHNLVSKTNGTVWSWGDNDLGQLSIGVFGGFKVFPTPSFLTAATQLNGVIAVAAGTKHSLALRKPTHSVKGTLYPQGNLNPAGTLVTFEFRPTDGTDAFTLNALLDADNSFLLPAVQAGAYDVWIKTPQTLAQIEKCDITDNDAAIIGVLMPSGDCDDNNKVDFDDFLIILDAYDTTVSDTTGSYDVRADLNHSGGVNFDDFLLLLDNYDTVGAP